MLGFNYGKKKPRWLLAIVLFTFWAMIFSYGSVRQTREVSERPSDKVMIKVMPGMNTKMIADLLYEHRLIDNVLAFRVMAKFNGLDGSLKAGDYVFEPNMGYSDIMQKLARGQVALFNLTVPEGYNVDQIAKLLEEKGIARADEVKKLARDYAPYDYITEDEQSAYRIEGFLFPDTYQVADGQNARDILRVMSSEFDHQFTPEMRERAKEMGLTIRNVVILASLVEKEAKLDEDRPIIAQVFLNRIREDMPLQSCATIQYILGEPKAELSIQDTEIPSPYNSYQHRGLPPGPIANPGVASIKAVLYAPPTDYLYFVADSNGKHHFSKTYSEHLETIDRI